MPSSALVVRAARTTDAVDIVRLVKDLAAHVGDRALAKLSVQDVEMTLRAPAPTWRGLVAEAADGSIVGACLYSLIFSTWRGRSGLYIIDLFIADDVRRAGIGKRLLAAAARDGQAVGCTFIRLEVDNDNPSAAGFYERLGFSEVTRNRTFTLADAGFADLASGDGP